MSQSARDPLGDLPDDIRWRLFHLVDVVLGMSAEENRMVRADLEAARTASRDRGTDGRASVDTTTGLLDLLWVAEHHVDQEANAR